ncbi:MAG: hypothetical protein AMJ62_03325 [Myxococcales bacterium SG8_38]|nr:MAG: hypothetical protein AMJ62_03325 [Myxococcales bacterium SG8_38]
MGCERGAPAPAQHHAEHAAHDHHAASSPAADEKSEVPAGPRIETGMFLLSVAPAQPEYRVGKPGEVELALEGRGEWHVNQEYPIRVDLSAGPALKLEKQKLVKDDAKEFGEEKVRFVAALEPSAAGEHEVRCDVSFAMCTDENCILEKRTVTMQVEVE